MKNDTSTNTTHCTKQFEFFRNAWIQSLQSSINVTEKKLRKIQQFSEKYAKYKKLFQNNVETELSNYQSWNHEVRLKNEKKSTFNSIYKLAKNEFKILKNYIEKLFKKRFIRSSKSTIESSILFTFKKNKKLWLCVNYKQLNNITVKNQYALSFISDIQNRIIEIKIFTKINLRENYHRIKIKKNEKLKIVFRIRY